MTSKSTQLLSLGVLLLWSCGRSGGNSVEVWQTERDNIEEVQVVSIVDSLPDMYSIAGPIIALGDTIIYRDGQSTDRLYVAYNVATGRYLGSFGKFGNGPGEIANFGSEFLDKQNRIMYGQSYSQWNYACFELDKAIGDADYNAYVKVTVPTDASKMPANGHHYVNDTTVICGIRQPNQDWTAFEFRLGRLNLTKGVTTILPGAPPLEDDAKYIIAVSPEHNLIVAAGLTNNRVNLYDLEGNLKKSVFGRNYRPEIRKRRYYNSSPVITDDKIYFVYRRSKQWEYGDEIIEMDHDGNYIRTLHPGLPIISMIHHPGSNRLYFSAAEEPQFGYIQL